MCVNLLRTKDAQAQELAMLAGDELHMNLRRLACTERQAANTQYVLVVQGLDSAMDVLRKGKQPPRCADARPTGRLVHAHTESDVGKCGGDGVEVWDNG